MATVHTRHRVWYAVVTYRSFSDTTYGATETFSHDPSDCLLYCVRTFGAGFNSSISAFSGLIAISAKWLCAHSMSFFCFGSSCHELCSLRPGT